MLMTVPPLKICLVLMLVLGSALGVVVRQALGANGCEVRQAHFVGLFPGYASTP